MFEIEMKAHLRDREGVRKRLEALATFVGKGRKRDRYYAPAALSVEGIDWERNVSFRLRETEDRQIVTCKRKRREGGLEINDELEFTIDDPGAFDRFARCLGFLPLLTKEKHSETYRKGAFTIELNEVKGLVWFIEIECLCDDAGAAERIRGEILDLFKHLGIAGEDIEPRYYVEMLRARLGSEGREG